MDDANLQVMNTMKTAFEIPVGFSNNGFENDFGEIDFELIPYAAAALGMDVYEIHITIDRTTPGADQGFSTEPAELVKMMSLVNSTRSEFLTSKDFNNMFT